jgi:tetratricopeptide (TPR) repeat protein
MAGRTQEVSALLRQATILRRSGQLAGSVAIMQQAACLCPSDVHIQHDLGLTLANLGQPAEALPYLDRAVALDPNFGHAHLRRGLALEALSRPGAEQAYQQAIAATPNLAEAYARLASILHRTGRRHEAIVCYREAASRARDKLAGGLYGARAALLEPDLDAAEGCLRQVLAINASAPEALGMLAYIQKARGDFAGAEAGLTQALQVRPSEVGLYYGLVQSRKIRPDETDLIGRMQAAVSFDVPPLAKVRLHQALAKALDDIGDYQEAASQLEAASALLSRHWPADRNGLVALVDRLIEVFTPAWLARVDHQRDPSEVPILVLGMPRSGTTLVEQILSSHRMVAGGGEIHFWQIHGQAFLQSFEPRAVNGRAIGEAFLKRLRAVSPEAERVVDKNPFNFMWAGLVHLVFPNARIVHCRRNPADTCLSVMLADLMPQPMFSNARDDLVFYYWQYQRLMVHYRSVLPADRFLDLDYEKLVEDPSSAIPALIEFCGLPWDEACLTPERNRRMVLTASVWQVRQPIHRSSTGRRRHYEALLRPFVTLSEAQ